MDVNRRALIAVVVAIIIAGVAGWVYSQCRKPEETSIPYYFIAIHSEPHSVPGGEGLVFNSMNSGVYGAVTHSIQTQAEPYYAFLEFLHFKDPSGERSRTVSEIIEQGLLPEETIPEELVNSKLPPLPPAINH